MIPDVPGPDSVRRSRVASYPTRQAMAGLDVRLGAPGGVWRSHAVSDVTCVSSRGVMCELWRIRWLRRRLDDANDTVNRRLVECHDDHDLRPETSSVVLAPPG